MSTTHPQDHQQPQQPAKKPIFKKVWFWLVALLAVIVIVAVANSGGSEPVSENVPSTGAPVSPEPPAEEPSEAPAEQPADDPLSDDDWTISEITLDDSSGFGTAITARVTNNADSTRTGLFTLTIFKDGQMLTSTDGVANDVEAGSTATVTFIGTTGDELPADGNYTYELQSNF